MEINLICHLNPDKTDKYLEILNSLKLLKKEGFYAHEGIGVRVYVNCNEEGGKNPWFQDEDMKYMKLIEDKKIDFQKNSGEYSHSFSIGIDIQNVSRFQYRYIIIYDVPIFKKIGSTMRHIYSLINVSQLEDNMPTYFGNRVLPEKIDNIHEDIFNLATVKSKKGACAYLFNSLIIGSDGKTTLCCVDDGFKLDLGNMKNGFEKIWNGEKLYELRRNHILGEFQKTPLNSEGIPICLLCQEWFTPRLHPDNLKRVKDARLSTLYEQYIKRIDMEEKELTEKINPYLTFELSSNCNLSCSFCSQKNQEIKNKNNMDFSLFSEFLDDLVKSSYEFENINLFFRGESLIHPEFTRFIKKIEDISRIREIFKFVVLHTNGIYLKGETADSLLSIYSQRILPYCGNLVISVDGYYEKTYRKLRGGDIKIVEENIVEFIRKRKEREQFGPNLIIQFIVFEENKSEAGKFIEKWCEILKSESDKKFRICATLENQPTYIDSDIIYLRVEATPGIGDPVQREKISKERYMEVVEKLGLKIE